jgi:hypothetical protein
MQYKSIILELLQDLPELYEQLRSSKRLLPAIDAYAIELKTAHAEWMEQLSESRPDSDPSQLASEALELAIQDLTGRLLSVSPKDEAEPALSLDDAMTYIKRHTPSA